ncbi:uncharacterized protein CTHT_0024320 [Thermochaetoides thermophila DSM 1495]|uniref:L-dopachrome isomerase n=1 Tax=Chaetomium thermophilum (strain DSM 1495 / CBS 144.50 / IMI 039719) TaxID=759272 RepID=G0S5C5_CHATD|nr:hypothetical protein CTHT_0024320 [Thermochaetoides thermophila DSM 1495]EGS20598.1 hypothetical protein CTHT_0024320 [Thermochaetoides thermophila DSM 1495]
MKAIRAIRSRRLPGDVARARESSPKRRESQDKGEEQATDASGVLTGVFTSPSLSRREDEVEKEKQVQRLHALAKDRVHGDALVLAEVKTNVIISDEFTFITELSYHLSTRYRRPVSSIAVTVHHGVCMFFAGSFDPAYILTISAPREVLYCSNNLVEHRRNATQVMRHMEESLGVGCARGLVRLRTGVDEKAAGTSSEESDTRGHYSSIKCRRGPR